MKAIIDGKRYDTSKAEELATAGPCAMGKSDFHWWEETLYRTSSGAYFLAGQGGPLTRYATPVGNNGRGYGERITPLSSDEARAWLEEHLHLDALERLFAEEIQDA